MDTGSTFSNCMVLCQGASNCYIAVYVASSNMCYYINATITSNTKIKSNNDCTIGLIAVNSLVSKLYS